MPSAGLIPRAICLKRPCTFLLLGTAHFQFHGCFSVWLSACPRVGSKHRHHAPPRPPKITQTPALGRSRADQPIRISLALCSFRPLTRRRCGGRGGPGCRGPGRLGLVAAAAAMEWSSESAAVRRHRGAAERREGEAAEPHREREASAPEDASGGGRTRKRSTESGGASRGAGTALCEARTVLALALYLLALRALVQLSLQRLVLSRPAGLQGEFDARQARYGRPSRLLVRCCPRRGSPAWGIPDSACLAPVSPGSVSPRRVSLAPRR